MPFTRIQIRQATAANWTSDNPTLAMGEWGIETDTGQLKMGNGSEAWADLDYFAAGGGGPAGADGASAYEVAVAEGFVGDEAAWLASLVGAAGADGADGVDGADGASAYAVAVAEGFVGDETAWLASLVGADGADGSNGADGAPGADGADGAQGPPGPITKSITVPAPEAGDDFTLFFCDQAMDVIQANAVIRGSTPSATWTIRHGADRSAAGTELVTSGTTTTDQATGTELTTFDAATVAAGSWVWLEIPAISGDVEELHLSLELE